MAPPKDDFSFYYLISVGVPLLIVALLGRFVSWWLALAVWEVGALIFFAWRRPWRSDWHLWRNIVIVATGMVYGITFITGVALEKFFPKIANL